MHVNQAQTPTHQQVFFQKVHNLSVVGLDRRWKRLEQRKDGFSVFQCPAGKLSNDKGMTNDLAGDQ